MTKQFRKNKIDIENINLLRHLVWSFHKTTGVDWDDLFQEAVLAYLENIDKYDPELSKRTTYMWCIIKHRLSDYVTGNSKAVDEKPRYSEGRGYNIVWCDLEEARETHTNNTAFWDTIPVELQEAARYIVQNGNVLDCYTPEEARRQIRAMFFRAGYTRSRVRQLMKGLTEIFKKR